MTEVLVTLAESCRMFRRPDVGRRNRRDAVHVTLSLT